ncbi:hypothetical protein GOODEAATRI_022270 [Goodea atripinnis]|uniref:Uncharacterized protein n=1 Tax=Goodea atripinnis TaxID=208336 RepID=A0ABV0NE73_9TELE
MLWGSFSTEKLMGRWVELNLGQYLKKTFKGYKGLGTVRGSPSSRTMTLQIQPELLNSFDQSIFIYLNGPSQSPDLNPILNLRQDFKVAVHRNSSFKLTELEVFCQDKSAKNASITEKWFHRGGKI